MAAASTAGTPHPCRGMSVIGNAAAVPSSGTFAEPASTPKKASIQRGSRATGLGMNSLARPSLSAKASVSSKASESSEASASSKAASPEELSSESQWASFDVGPDGPSLPAGTVLDLPGRGQLFVRDTGLRPGAATVVLLHGWGATVDLNFFRTYGDLAEQYRVVAFDMRGHGRGLRPRAFFRLEDCADDVIAVADALGIEKVIPIGYSMGGVVAQLVAHRHPTRVAGVVLCATSKRFRSTGRERVLWDTTMSLAAAALTLTPAGLRTNLLGKFLIVRKEPGTPKWMLDELGRTDPALVVQAGLAIGRYDATAWIGELGIEGTSGIPASVVIMQHDQTISTPRQRKLAAALSGATSFEVDADHRAAVNNPELFNPALLAALASVTAKR
jgi:3-oxoadipate enol-lactonase